MRIFFDIITILGFVLTVLGTYLTIRSGDGEIIIKDEFLRYGFIIIIVLSYIAYNYCRKYHIAKSVFKGRSKMIEVFSKSIELGEVLRNGKPSLNSCIEKFSILCQLVAKGLREYINVPVSVCLLYVNQDDSPKHYYVKTLSRDIDTNIKRNQKSTLYDGIKDYISDNTDFSKIVKLIDDHPAEDVYFYSNCLPAYLGYRNTHIIGRWRSWFYRTIAFLTFGLFCWNLPYKSAIVVPVIPYNKQGKKYIEGFICIDSPRIFPFLKQYDLAILRDVASGLYPILELFNKKYMK